MTKSRTVLVLTMVVGLVLLNLLFISTSLLLASVRQLGRNQLVKVRVGVSSRVPTVAVHGLAAAATAARFNATQFTTTTTVDKLNEKGRPVLEIVTAFSENHVLEAVNCLKTLIQVGYTGPLTIYYLKRSMNESVNEQWHALRQQVAQSSLMNATAMLEYVVSPSSSSYMTYCFKPEVIEYHLMQQGGRPLGKVLMWMDTSTRFTSNLFVNQNPELGAQQMLDANITFVGLTGNAELKGLYLGLGESTHHLTWRYLNRSHMDYAHFYEIVGTHFLINLLRPDFLQKVLEPWLDCGVRHCYECMSPPGSAKAMVGEIRGPNSTQIITHRHDQSVLGILVYDWMTRHGGKIELGRYRYGSDKMRVDVKWDDRAPFVDLTSNITTTTMTQGMMNHRTNHTAETTEAAAVRQIGTKHPAPPGTVAPPPVSTMMVHDPAARFNATRFVAATRIATAASVKSNNIDAASRPILEIITAFTDNHLLEGVNCLKTLIQVGYKGPLTIYYLKRSTNESVSEQWRALRQQVAQSSLKNATTMLEYVVSPTSSNYMTYCFKPEVIEYHLMKQRRRPHQQSLGKVLMWMDTSTRFTSNLFVNQNPELGARQMLDANITFVGLTGNAELKGRYLGMGESTHHLTWQYLNRSHIDYAHFYEIVGTHFLINLLRTDFLHHVLEPWLDCGVRHCYECMSPPGSAKEIVGKIRGPNSTRIITHRQDQSVLGILVYDWMTRYGGKIELGRYRYGSDKMRVDVKWDDRAPIVDLTSKH